MRRSGTRIGVDVGKVRIGIARSDPGGTLAVPVETVKRTRDGSDVGTIAGMVAEYEACEVVVGLPLSLSGGRTASTEDASQFAERLALALSVPVRMVDERLSTVSAQSSLHAAGISTRESRSVIDQVAAAVILQNALDAEGGTGTAPGQVVHPSGGRGA